MINSEWTVCSSSYKPDYKITGLSLVDAVKNCFDRIGEDIRLPAAGKFKVLNFTAEYYPEILNKQGGVELSIEWAHVRGGEEGTSKNSIVWIHAEPKDLKERHYFVRKNN